MAQSIHLKNLKAIWAKNCHSMWAELFCTHIAEQELIAKYASIPSDRLLADLYYTPDLRPRLGTFPKDLFLSKLNSYRSTITSNRIVILCAAFEAYFLDFLDDYIKNRSKYYDIAATAKTDAGNKLYGDVKKARGLVARITTFSALSDRRIKSITPHLDHISDLYILRNVMAHAAGMVDSQASSELKIYKFSPDQMVSISSDQIVEIAGRIMLVAESLDARITPQKI